MLKYQKTNKLGKRKTTPNAEFLVGKKHILKRYFYLTYMCKQIESMQQDRCAEEYSIKIIKLATYESN